MRTAEVKSAGRILDVLELLAGLPQGIRLNQLARTLAIPKSSASALLGTLSVRGYVETRSDGYRLVSGYRSGGWVGGITGTLVRAGHPIMERLVADTGESAFLGVATPSFEVRYVAKVVSANPLRYDVELESLRPAHSTSIGQILLASLTSEELDDYFRQHALAREGGHPASSAAGPPQGARPLWGRRREAPLRGGQLGERAVRRAINQAREQGYVTIADSHVIGTSGAAAPVSASGQTVAGLAIIAPTARFDTARNRIVPRVVAAARELGRAIGGEG